MFVENTVLFKKEKEKKKNREYRPKVTNQKKMEKKSRGI